MAAPEKTTIGQDILAHLQGGEPLTALSAFRLFGTMRLAKYINQLKAQGHAIHTEHLRVRTRRGKATIASYSIPKP